MSKVNNQEKFGDQFSRYVALRSLAKQQNTLIRKLRIQIGILKSDLSEKDYIIYKLQERIFQLTLLKSLKPMIIWPNYKKRSEYLNILASRNCWTYCYHCQQRWSHTNTEKIHMLRLEISGTDTTRFCCDTCLPELQENAEIFKP